MRTRRLCWVASAAAGLGVVALLSALLLIREAPDPLRPANFDRIALGMSRAEVEAILHPTPPCSSGPHAPGGVTLPEAEGPYTTLGWYGPTYLAFVCLDGQGKVAWRQTVRHLPPWYKQLGKLFGL